MSAAETDTAAEVQARVRPGRDAVRMAVALHMAARRRDGRQTEERRHFRPRLRGTSCPQVHAAAEGKVQPSRTAAPVHVPTIESHVDSRDPALSPASAILLFCFETTPITPTQNEYFRQWFKIRCGDDLGRGKRPNLIISMTDGGARRTFPLRSVRGRGVSVEGPRVPI